MAELRCILELRSGFSGKEIRIERVSSSSQESKTREGCPVAKWIIRRSSNTERILALVKEGSRKTRLSSSSSAIVTIIALVIWDAIDSNLADKLYDVVAYKTANFGIETDRKCSLNETSCSNQTCRHQNIKSIPVFASNTNILSINFSFNAIPGRDSSRSCACQGIYGRTRGACFSFGCSWSMFYDGCKFGRSHENNIRKFKLTKRDEEPELENIINDVSSIIGPIYKLMAPDAYQNHIIGEPSFLNCCRIGWGKERPFSGVTACLDFCAHNHKDTNNLDGGATVILTLKNRLSVQVSPSDGRINDDQYHILPGYFLLGTSGSEDTCKSIQVLNKFPQKKRLRKSRLGSCKERKEAALGFKLSQKANEQNLHPLPTSFGSSSIECQGVNNTNESSFSCERKKVVKHTNERNEVIYEIDSDNEDALVNGSGIALALTHGSLLIECAKLEVHASSAINNPSRIQPSRVSLVFYQHKNLKKPNHGKLDVHHKENWN